MTYRRMIAVAFLILLAGCGKSGPQIAPVQGLVTLDGRPLAGADIQFQPQDADRPSRGRTDNEGRYVLMYKRGQPGAVVGPHTIRIWVSPEVVRNPPVIAARFNSNSELREEVKPGSNELNFEVSAEKK